jgi:hypothetical protein
MMLGAHCSSAQHLEWVKLAMAVGDIGQAPKVEDLAQSVSAGYDEELTREADTAI